MSLIPSPSLIKPPTASGSLRAGARTRLTISVGPSNTVHVAANILDRAQKMCARKDLNDKSPYTTSHELDEVAVNVAEELNVVYSDALLKQILGRWVELLEADISTEYHRQEGDLELQ